jgi:exopolysaccharide production protein ExoZ
MAAKYETIGSLQALRGLSALAVVFYHAGYLIGGFHADFGAVATFFVISGFIMCFIAEREPADFFQRRLIRIVPMYWLCTIVLALVVERSAFFRFWNWHADFTTSLFRSLLFLPSADAPMLGVGWTLNLEMYFYVLFAAALRISPKHAPILTAAAVVSILSLPAFGCAATVCKVYAHPYVYFFLYGIILYYAWSFLRTAPPSSSFGYAAWALVVLCYVVQAATSDAIYPVVIVAAALLASTANADLRWRPAIILGDASYSIYLTHTIVMRLINAGDFASNSLAASIGVMALSGMIGVAAHILIERPLTVAVKRSWLSRRGSRSGRRLRSAAPPARRSG